MATDPRAGIVYATMYTSNGGVLSDGVQFSGVMIAPDEILTAAHCVTGSGGITRNAGVVCAGYDGAPSAQGSVGVENVHVIDASHNDTTLTDAQVSTDYAVVHLSQAISGGAVFSLASALAGGNFTVDGYPASTAGHLAELQETLSAGSVSGELTGSAIAGTNDSRGGSGGPVWYDASGTPTVVGIASGAASNGTGVFKALTSQDIAQIDAWIQADHEVEPSASNTSGLATAVVSPPDRLDQLSSQLQADAHGGTRGQMLTDVATTLSSASQEGYTYSDLPDAVDQIASLLRSGSKTPSKSVAFMAGLMSAEAGAPSAPARLLSYISNNFGFSISSKTARQFVNQGYAEDGSLAPYAATALPVASPHEASITALAAALQGQSDVASSSSTTYPNVSGSSPIATLLTGGHPLR